MCSPRQFNYLDFISQFTADICHISGQDNIVADALSRFEAISAPVTHDAFAAVQEKDDELRSLLVSTTALQLERLLISGTSVELYCDTSSGKPRPYVPSPLRRQILNSLHSLSHPGIKASAKPVSQRFVWPAMQKDCRTWAPSLPTLPALQSFPPYHHSRWRLSPTTCPFPSHPHRPSRFSSFLGRILILPHGCRPFHVMAESLSYPGHHSRDSVTCPALWLDCKLWLSSNHNH